MQPAMFFGPGQQPAFVPPNAAGRGGMPFGPQQGMMLPGMQGGRPGQVPGMPAPQGGRGGQQIPPNAFGIPGQFPFGAMPGAGPGAFPNMGYPQALAQVQATLGRGGQGGRGQIPGMQGMPGIPQQMMGMQNMRGRDSRPQYPTQQGRGGIGAMGMGMQQDQGRQTGGYAGGRGRTDGPMSQPSIMQNASAASSTLENITSAPSANQKQMLGEALYPKILQLQPILAGKITGMLLEMDNAELFGL